MREPMALASVLTVSNCEAWKVTEPLLALALIPLE